MKPRGRAAYIKVSTDVKSWLPSIEANAIKVWLYIALSVGRDDTTAKMSLRTIARGTGMSVNTVRRAVKHLEDMRILFVLRRPRRCNQYRVLGITSNGDFPSVSDGDTDGAKTVSKNDAQRKHSVSENDTDNGESVSKLLILNHSINLINSRSENMRKAQQESGLQNESAEQSKPISLENLDWLIASGAPQEAIQRCIDREARDKEICRVYEESMGYGSVNWESPKMKRLLSFLRTKPLEEIKQFARWCRRPFSTFDPVKARLHPDLVQEFWPLATDRSAFAAEDMSLSDELKEYLEDKNYVIPGQEQENQA